MTVMDVETSQLLTASLRALFGDLEPGSDPRPALAELGWAEVRQAYPEAATTLLFAEQGRGLASSALLDDIVLAELALDGSSARRGLLYPTAGEAALPDTARADSAHPDGAHPDGAPVRGVLLCSPDVLDEIVIPFGHATPAGAGIRLRAVAASELAGHARPLGGFARDSGWFAVEAPAAPSGTDIENVEPWPVALAAGRRALAAEIIGVCEAALELVVAHTSARHQYGHPIGTFQSVRHRLAEAHVGIVAAKEVLSLAGRDDAGAAPARDALLAKAQAGRAQAVVMRHLLQFFGAMGLSAEASAHRHVSRAAVLDSLLGNHRMLLARLGQELLDGADMSAPVTI